MGFKRITGFLLTVVTVVVYLFDPVCLQALPVPRLIFCGTLLLGSIILLMSPANKLCVDPSNKAVFITGCDSGFGHSLARRLDKLGFTVFAACLLPDRKGAEELKEQCSSRLHIVQLDVTDDWQVRGAVKYVKEHTADKSLWALVNNAGIAVFQEIEWCSVTQFQQIMDVNVIGVVRVTKAFLPLVRQAKGRVINVASLAGRFTVPAFAAYSMSKKACIAFSDGLRQEMRKFGIQVITIEPTLYKTPIASENYLIDSNRKSWAETPSEVKDVYGDEYFDAFLKTISQQMKRARGNVEEVVDQMVEAVTTSNPKHRYVPYWLSSLRATVLMYMPDNVTDLFFGSLYKINAVPVQCKENDKIKKQF